MATKDPPNGWARFPDVLPFLLMHILSAAEMQACDRATTEQFGIRSRESSFPMRGGSQCCADGATTAAMA
jgi:hypothetical protein